METSRTTTGARRTRARRVTLVGPAAIVLVQLTGSMSMAGQTAGCPGNEPSGAERPGLEDATGVPDARSPCLESARDGAGPPVMAESAVH